MISEISSSSSQVNEQVSNASSQPDKPSPEEQQQMLQFLLGLEDLRVKDPEAFEQTMTQLGIGVPSAETPVKDKEQSQVDALKMLISSLKGDNSDPVAINPNGGINLPGAKSVPKGITITPVPGYVVKTREIATDMKVFINMCSHENIDGPGLKKRLNENGESVEGMNIPMSCGPGRNSVDKAGISCRAYDIIVNPKVIEEGVEDKSGKYRDFVAQLGIQSIEHKYGIPMDRRYKLPVLKNNYMGGEIESQMIQDRKSMPKIEEVTSDSPAARAAAAARVKKQADDARLVREAIKAQETALEFKFAWVNSASEQVGQEKDLFLSANVHIDPIVVPPSDDIDSIVCIADLVRSSLVAADLDIKLSPFKLAVKIPGHKLSSFYLPCAVHPASARCSISRREGYTKLIQLRICLPLDKTPWGSKEDAGSKQWLVTHALRGGGAEDTYNPYDETTPEAIQPSVPASFDEELPEDKFHLKFPPNVDPYTGQVMGSSASTGRELDDQQEFPEDRFHQKDAASQFIIQQREHAVKDKWEKHNKEKAERVDDPNVEYVDMDDFKPGGKFGPPKINAVGAEGTSSGVVREELQKASEVLTSLAPTIGVPLSSTVWSELCD